MNSTFFAYLFVFLTLIRVLFQLALAGGMPWGILVMGGRYPGKISAQNAGWGVDSSRFAGFYGDNHSISCQSGFSGFVKSIKTPDLGSGCHQRAFTRHEPDYAEQMGTHTVGSGRVVDDS